MSKVTTFTMVEAVLARYVPAERKFRSVYTLDTMQSLMAALGNPQHSYKVIHIAGTSGKTSTAYYTAALLHAAGKRVGLTVSPHVHTINERVQVGLVPLPEAQYCQLFTRFMELLNKTGIQPTYFELLVAFAFWSFAELEVDHAVIEVGLGGLLDGTNVVTRSDKVSVLTDIGLDHVAVLGNTLPEIAAQKAGIVLTNSDVFCFKQGEAVDAVFQETARASQARLHYAHLAPQSTVQNLPLFQQRNWSLAFTAVKFVIERDGHKPLTAKQLHQSTLVHIPARMEIRETSGMVMVLDSAHNPQKMHALVDSLKSEFPGEKFAVLFALLRSQDERVADVLTVLLPIASHVIVTDFIAAQDLRKYSCKPDIIKRVAQELGFENVEVITDTKLAYAALKARPEHHKLVTGSFYLMHDLHTLVGEL